ncbi:MAG: hypothetical protein M3Q89_13700 [Verrucomicrobiota bacterium]|nr:hypothetical protein [Verrucomicrobiota bacterium]
MNRKLHPLRAVALGLIVMLVQVFLAVELIAPEGPLSYRYNTLIQHDSYWFANIIDRGYDTILPPIDRKLMEVSNVAFFPAYPAIAGALHHWFGFSTYDALLVTAQTAAWGFWSYFFLFCDRWGVAPLLQFFGGFAVVAHPTAFFLVAGYSESLFLMALLGFIYWTTASGRTAKVLAVGHGIVMSATRIVGLPCAVFPFVRAIFEGGWERLRDVRRWVGNYAGAVALVAAASLGTFGFFLYCLFRWGRWDLYMLTQEAGWAIEPDYLAVFKPESYRWLVPPMNDPTQWSQMTMTAGALCFVLVALCELIPALRRRTGWQHRIGLYFAAVVTYFIAVSGVASVQMESMLRYQFCAHALIVLALLHFLAQFRPLPPVVRAFGMTAVALLCAAGLSLQGWWIWNFTRGDWVA